MGAGRMLTYQTEVLDVPVNFKLKYTREFEARRRFESEVFTASFGVHF